MDKKGENAISKAVATPNSAVTVESIKEIAVKNTSLSIARGHNLSRILRARKVSVLRATGAGDAWNAGNVFGDALGLPDHLRLTLANAVAAYYISSPAGEHPTLPKLVDFCSKQLSTIKD